jgi:hypothetical protein
MRGFFVLNVSRQPAVFLPKSTDTFLYGILVPTGIVFEVASNIGAIQERGDLRMDGGGPEAPKVRPE